MAIISAANLKAYADRVGWSWGKLKAACGIKTSTAVAGTVRKSVELLYAAAQTDLDDYEQQVDLTPAANAAVKVANVQSLGNTMLAGLIRALEDHCSTRGAGTDASITTLGTYLSYLNTTKFSDMVTPEFAEAYYNTVKVELPAVGVMSPQIAPVNGQANGMGIRAVGGSFTSGAAVVTASYSEVSLIAAVTVDFAGGGAPPTVTVAGTDHTGSTGTTWSATLTGNNPLSAVTTTTSEAITGHTRQVVTLASAAGIVPGSLLTVDAGSSQETVIVEAVSSNDVTAAFSKDHLSGAAVTAVRAFTLAPSVGGRRCRSVSGITIGVSAHSTGTVRIEGVQDRVGV